MNVSQVIRAVNLYHYSDDRHLFIQYFEYTAYHEIRHNIQKELCLRSSQGVVQLQECGFKGKNSRTPEEEKWELRKVFFSLSTK